MGTERRPEFLLALGGLGRAVTQSHDGDTGGYGFLRKAEMSVVVLSVLPVYSIRIERMILKKGGSGWRWTEREPSDGNG